MGFSESRARDEERIARLDAASKHTPGPWERHERYDVVIARLGGEGEAFRGVADCRTVDVEGEERAANARLIAAAPDLLDALMTSNGRGLCIFPNHGPDEPCPGCDGWRKGQAAIAKALGLEWP
jgi:hypothetical protein